MNLVICTNCKWIHFKVNNDLISEWKKTWDRFWPTLDKQGRDSYGLPNGPPTPEEYYVCFRCGIDYKNMRDVTDKDVIREGSTIQPILGREYEKNKDWDK